MRLSPGVSQYLFVSMLSTTGGDMKSPVARLYVVCRGLRAAAYAWARLWSALSRTNLAYLVAAAKRSRVADCACVLALVLRFGALDTMVLPSHTRNTSSLPSDPRSLPARDLLSV